MLGVAVLGCGRIGRIHAQNLSRHPRVKLAAVFDVAAGTASHTAEQLGTVAVESLDQVWSDPTIAAVLIATPTDTHIPLIKAAVDAGKAVFCEKPVDLDLARAETCWREIASGRPRIMIGFNRRFDPSFRSLRARIQKGEVGALELAILTSRDPAPPPVAYLKSSGGLFRDMTIHDFDMARYLAGEIVQVQAFGSNLVDPEIGTLRDIDTCCVTLRAQDGALIQINNSRRCAYGYDQRIEVFGSKGMLQAGNRYATSVASWSAERTGAREPLLHFFLERYREAYESELDTFVSAVEGTQPFSPDYRDGLEALRLADAAQESLGSGQVVNVRGVDTGRQ